MTRRFVDEEAVGLIAWILIGLGGLIVAVGAAGGIMYASDTMVGAVVTQTECGANIFGSPSSSVTVETKFPVPGVTHTLEEFDNDKCRLLTEGKSYAEYYIRSGRTILYEEQDGNCVYDSAKGLGC